MMWHMPSFFFFFLWQVRQFDPWLHWFDKRPSSSGVCAKWRSDVLRTILVFICHIDWICQYRPWEEDYTLVLCLSLSLVTNELHRQNTSHPQWSLKVSFKYLTPSSARRDARSRSPLHIAASPTSLFLNAGSRLPASSCVRSNQSSISSSYLNHEVGPS